MKSTKIKYLLLPAFKVYTVSYEPSFSTQIYGINPGGKKNEVP